MKSKVFLYVPSIYSKIKYTSMKKGQYLKELKDIKNISNAIRKMNEGIMFEDEYDDLQGIEQEEPMPDEEPIPAQEQEPAPEPQTEQEPVEQGVEAQADIKDVKPEDKGMEELDQMGELDQIRKITLQGMLKFANQPEHPQFQALQKIFQMCNKAVDNKENEQQQ